MHQIKEVKHVLHVILDIMLTALEQLRVRNVKKENSQHPLDHQIVSHVIQVVRKTPMEYFNVIIKQETVNNVNLVMNWKVKNAKYVNWEHSQI